MKSFCLIIFFILTIFVIKSETSISEQTRNEIIVIDGRKIWFEEVNGFDKNNPSNGYSGVFGEPITGLRVSGEKPYKVHLLNVGWLPKVNGSDISEDFNGYAGSTNGLAIDAVIISGGDKYAVHVLGEDWLSPVTGNDIHDSKNGYSGIIGKPIDAIMIENRRYATSYNIYDEISKCVKLGGSCSKTKKGGTALNGLCEKDEKCYIPKKYIDDAGDYGDYDYNEVKEVINEEGNEEVNNEEGKKNGGSSLNIIFLIIIIVLFIMISIVVLYYYYKRNEYKKNNTNEPGNPLGGPTRPSDYEFPPPPYQSLSRINQTNEISLINHNPSKKAEGTIGIATPIEIATIVSEDDKSHINNIYLMDYKNSLMN